MTILIDYFSFLFTLETQAKDNDSDLMTSLFSNYDSGARPVCGDGSAVQVKIGLAVRQIIDLVSSGLYFQLLLLLLRFLWHTQKEVTGQTA